MAERITESSSDDAFPGDGVRTATGASRASSTHHHFGRIAIIEASGQETEMHISGAEDDDPAISFIFLTKGSASYYRNGAWESLPSSLIIVPDGVRGRAWIQSEWAVTIVRVPRDALEPFVNEVPVDVTALRRRSLLDRAVQSFAEQLLEDQSEQTPTPTPIEAYAVEQLLLEMAGAILLDRMSGTWAHADKPNTVLLNESMAVIAQQCQDPEFGPAQVASEARASLRRVQAVFAEAGTSVAGEIRRRRARLAHSILENSRFDVLTIDQVARQSGFGTPMSMRRALVDIYGQTARDIRGLRGT